MSCVHLWEHPAPTANLVKNINFCTAFTQLWCTHSLFLLFLHLHYLFIHLFLDCEHAHQPLTVSSLNSSVYKHQNLIINSSKNFWFSPLLFLEFLLKEFLLFFRQVLCLCVELLFNPSFSFHTTRRFKDLLSNPTWHFSSSLDSPAC